MSSTWWRVCGSCAQTPAARATSAFNGIITNNDGNGVHMADCHCSGLEMTQSLGSPSRCMTLNTHVCGGGGDVDCSLHHQIRATRPVLAMVRVGTTVISVAPLSHTGAVHGEDLIGTRKHQGAQGHQVVGVTMKGPLVTAVTAMGAMAGDTIEAIRVVGPMQWALMRTRVCRVA